MLKVGVIGAGVAGLCAAIHLKELSLPSECEVIILEKEPVPGGLLRRTVHEGRAWDHGAFIINKNNFLARRFPDAFEPSDVTTEVWADGRFHQFPYVPRDLLLRQPWPERVATAVEYIYANLRLQFGRTSHDLHEWLRHRMGDRLLRQCKVEEYLFKVQGRPASELSASLGEHRLEPIHKLTRPQEILGALFDLGSARRRGKRLGGLYPAQDGVEMVASMLASLCDRLGVKVLYGMRIARIDKSDRAGFTIQCGKESGLKSLDVSHIISTMPLPDLVNACKSFLSPSCVAQAGRLCFMDMRLVLFIVARPVIRHRHLFLYSFERHHKWKRVVARSLGKGISSVLVEIAFDPGAEVVDDECVASVSHDLTKELFLFGGDEVLVQATTTYQNAYPVYEIGFEKLAAKAAQQLKSQGLHVAGRQGLFLYTDTSGAIQTAIKAVDNIVNAITKASD